jgi:hypothetical protein
VRKYLALVAEAEQLGAKIFVVDEAHFRADGDSLLPSPGEP